MKYLWLLLLTGCTASIHQIGEVGDTKYYSIKSPSLLGPTINMVVSMKTNETTPTIQGQAAGNGAVNGAVSAVGNVGAAAVLGQSWPADSTKVTTEFIGPVLPINKVPITIGNDSNDRPFTPKGK